MGARSCVAGLALVSGAGLAGEAWRGDLDLRRRRAALGAVHHRRRGAGAWIRWRATAVVAVLGGVAACRCGWRSATAAALLAQGWGVIATQALVQGVLSGVLAVFAYRPGGGAPGRGAGGDVPRDGPGGGVLLGIPVAGEWPNAGQWVGLGVVLAGLTLAMGLLPGRAR